MYFKPNSKFKSKIMKTVTFGGDDIYSGEWGGLVAFDMLVGRGLVGALVGATIDSVTGHKYEYKF